MDVITYPSYSQSLAMLLKGALIDFFDVAVVRKQVGSTWSQVLLKCHIYLSLC